MSNDISVEFDVPATMRDGVVLRANIFRPADDDIYPVALARTPYGKDFASVSPLLDAIRLARAGYIVVIQDVRGRATSEGDWSPFRYEAEDGYDTVEWAAGLPGSNGKVGMFGASYVGFTQWATAALNPPHLKAIMPTVTWGRADDGVQWRGGALELGAMAAWQLSAVSFDVILKRYADAEPQERYQALLELVREIDHLRDEGYWSLPLNTFKPIRRLSLAPEFFDLIAQHAGPSYTSPLPNPETYAQVTAPAYVIGGWYDLFCQGTLRTFNGICANGGSDQARQSKLLIGPWSHVNYGHTIGDADFGFASAAAFINLQTDMTGLTQRWFDYWLKGIDTGVTQEPPVKLFVMGENVWRDEQEWPLVRTRYTPYYLRSGGALTPDLPGAEPPDQYVYDPADPTPTHGGALLMHALFGPGVKDQRPIEAREDVLTFTTLPLAQDVEVTGPVTVELWAASDAPDTDFVARLVDVHPDGFAQNLTDGIVRARYREGDVPQLLEPGLPYLFTIDLWSTANVFKAGHRIRLDIASASFPRWDRNPNTADDFGAATGARPARQTILHDADHPSHVVLPIIPR